MMILTKRQLIDECYRGIENSRPLRKAINKALHMPELDFISMAKNELNMNLEPIRKNQYIIN